MRRVKFQCDRELRAVRCRHRAVKAAHISKLKPRLFDDEIDQSPALQKMRASNPFSRDTYPLIIERLVQAISAGNTICQPPGFALW